MVGQYKGGLILRLQGVHCSMDTHLQVLRELVLLLLDVVDFSVDFLVVFDDTLVLNFVLS